ncbi:MAG: hypothetical protein ACI9UN_004015 [Granulosicoccus sp.]|jgi:hypothetical protein
MALANNCLGLTAQAEIKYLGWDLPKLCAEICPYRQFDEIAALKHGRSNEVSTARQLIAFMAIANRLNWNKLS